MGWLVHRLGSQEGQVTHPTGVLPTHSVAPGGKKGDGEDSYCTAASGGTSVPIYMLDQLSRLAMNSGKHMSCVFLDVASAYDSVVRQLVIPPAKPTPLLMRTLTGLGLSDESATSALSYLYEHPDSLINCRLPPHLIVALRTWMHGSWLTTPASSRAQHATLLEHCQPHRHLSSHNLFTPSPHTQPCSPSIQTRTGVMQGDPLSTTLFIAAYQVAIDYGLELLANQNPVHLQQFADLPVPQFRTLQLPAPPHRTTHLFTHIAYADDIVLPLASTDPKQLIRSTIAAVICFIKAFRTFGLCVNLAKNKSE
eukprot:574534-Amphidinium_carterae.1